MAAGAGSDASRHVQTLPRLPPPDEDNGPDTGLPSPRADARRHQGPTSEAVQQHGATGAQVKRSSGGMVARLTLRSHEKGRPERVCANTTAMLSSTRFAQWFEVLGSRTNHFGAYPCGPTLAVARHPATARPRAAEPQRTSAALAQVIQGPKHRGLTWRWP